MAVQDPGSASQRDRPGGSPEGTEGTPRSSRVLGARSLALISVAAVLTLRNMPSVAEYGWSSIAYYLLGALFFFVPLALVVAELGTGWPKAGGLYAWVKEGFGDRPGFLAVWFEWVENVPYFPTVLAFCAATFAFVVDPSLANDKVYLVIAMLVIFWGLTVANFFGMKWSARLNDPGVVFGTLVPAAVLIGLGLYWLAAGRHNQIPFHASKLAPNLGSVNNLVFFVAVLLSYGGIEMAGFHAKETRNPARDYPRAIFIATVLIVGISILATLAIAFVIPQAKLSLVAGLMQAFDAFFKAIGLGTWATKVMALLVGLGTLALISTWMLGPAKGLYATEQAGDLIPELEYVNKRHAPVAILVFQAALSSMLALLFLFVPSINTGYWMLTALTTQLVLMMYILVLCAAIRLRYSEPNTDRPYSVPGGRVGMWIVGGMGLLGCVFGFVMGFIPPTGVKHWATPVYIGAMVLGIVISTAPPFIIEKVKKRSWIMTHPDNVLVDVEGPPLGALELEHGEPDGDGADRRDDAKVQTDGHDRMPRT
jgi:glutamate:GABA antiporter